MGNPNSSPVATIHIPKTLYELNYTSWRALRPSAVLPGFSTSLTIASWDQPHNLTGPDWVSVFDYLVAKDKGHQKLDLSISLSLGICAHGIWQPKRAVYQTSTCFLRYLFSARPEHSRGFMSCLLNFSEYNSCCDLLGSSSPTEIPSHQRSPRFRNTAHRTEHATLDATLLC